jgi:hypothetical protein
MTEENSCIINPPPLDINININNQIGKEICELASKTSLNLSNKEFSHPFETYEFFSHHPPIPVFNFIIDSKTGEIIEDKTGQA